MCAGPGTRAHTHTHTLLKFLKKVYALTILQCDCCKLNEKDSLVTSLPDLSLCYKLHLECGKYINLFDWLQAFIAVVNDDEEEPSGGKHEKKKIDETLQYPFFTSFYIFYKPLKCFLFFAGLFN